MHAIPVACLPTKIVRHELPGRRMARHLSYNGVDDRRQEAFHEVSRPDCFPRKYSKNRRTIGEESVSWTIVTLGI